MNCPECDSTMKTGTMLCTNNDWRINDNSGNLKMIVEIHDISDGDEEIGDTYSREYCECGQFPPIVSFEEIAYTESDVVNLYTGAKTISDVVNNLMSINSFDESESIDLIKNTNPYVKDWSI
tara:strand:- start:131 stop:496 length:366 start_codon:yes stop_codon:yes gene_type:complete